MNLSYRDMKTEARRLLGTGDSNKNRPIMIGLIYVMLCLTISILTEQLFIRNFTVNEINLYLQYYMDGDLESCLGILERCAPSASAYWISALLALVGVILNAGFTVFLLNAVRNNAPCMGNLLDGFGFWWKAILLDILKEVFVALWSLLLVFPGVIARYRYRQALYILCEDPSKGVLQCIRESKQMMKGHKWELFVYDLTFLGWLILEQIPYLGYAVKFYAVPYIGLSRTVYYDRLKQQSVAL